MPPVAAARNGLSEVMRSRSYPPIELLDPPSRGSKPFRGAANRTVHPVDPLVSMTQNHPDLADEQAYIDHAYECLEQSRAAAWRLRDLNEADLGGTFQA